jgi:hypothetical protein
MSLKIILTKNGKRFDRLYNLVETDIFEFYTKLINQNLATVVKEIEESGGFISIDLNKETLAATIGFHNISDEIKEEINNLLFPHD